MPCPKCRCADVTIRRGVGAAPTGSARVECLKCGRFIEWRKDTAGEAEKSREKSSDGCRIETKAESSCSPALEVEELGSPEAWLYVSKRLDLQWVPNTPLWAAPAFTIDSTVYYRLTSRVLVWLEAAGEQLQRQYDAGKLERSQLLAYVDAMEVVWAFARNHIAREAVAAARGRPLTLPDGPVPK